MFINNNHLRFFVIGDWGRNGQHGQKETADCMAEIARSVRPDFIVSTGDNFYERGVQSTEDLLWELSFETVYHHRSLQVPWYAILGNHDYMGNAQAQVDYTQKSRRWRMPDRFFKKNFHLSFTNEALFVFLDTNPFINRYYEEGSLLDLEGSEREAQLKWLKKTLQGTRAKWKILVGHHPLYSAGTMHGNNEELIKTLEPIMDEYGVQAYFAGHEHDLQHLKPLGKTHHFVSGAGSMMRETGISDISKFTANHNGFLDVALVEDFMQVRIIKGDGEVAYSAHIDREVADSPLMYIKKVV